VGREAVIEDSWSVPLVHMGEDIELVDLEMLLDEASRIGTGGDRPLSTLGELQDFFDQATEGN
jgi:hypothetical protein